MAMTPTTGVGIFGPTAGDLRQEYLKNLQGQFSTAQSPYERMGLALGNIIGTAFGVKDPRLEQASAVQGIYSAVAQMHPNDQTTPEFYRELANTFAAAGMNEQAMMSAQKANEAARIASAESRAERGVAIQEERLKIDKERLQADIAKEARQGRLTEAQIRQIDAQIANLGSAYEYQVIKGPAGETTSILAINKKNPSDVRTINTTPDAAATPSAPVNAGEWNYVPGQGLVKGK
jgi:hypothetical protein